MDKQTLWNHCKKLLEDKLALLQKEIDEKQQSLSSETKSTAGDKHETGRAMVHLEMEKLGQQYATIQQELSFLLKTPVENHHQIQNGSWVQYNKIQVYISVSLGKIKFDNDEIFIISSKTPLAQKIMGQEVGFQFEINGKSYKIEKVV